MDKINLTPNVLLEAIRAVARYIGTNCEAGMVRAIVLEAAKEPEAAPAPAPGELRDYFAAKAMQGIVGDSESFAWAGRAAEKRGRSVEATIAKAAYELADAMLAARSAA